MKKKTKLTQQIAKSNAAPGENSIGQTIAPDKFVLSLLSYQAFFAGCQQSACYIRQSLNTCR